MCDSLPEEQRNVSGPAAQLGTATHGLIERCLKTGENPEDYRGRIIQLIGEEESVSILRKGAKMPGPGKVFFEVDSAIIESAEMMVTYVRERCEELFVDPATLQLETRTNPLPERDDTSGTADVTIDAAPDVLEVVDYKNGYLVVEHEDNEQLQSYLLGKAIEAKFAHKEFKITVCQPNASHEEGRLRSVSYTKAELLAFQKKHREAIERCEAAEAAFEEHDHTKDVAPEWADEYLKAGSHCTFCDAAAVCPKKRDLASDSAILDFSEEPRPITFTERPEFVARILLWKEHAESLIREATAYAARSMEAGHPIPDHKLVMGRTHRKLRDDIPPKKIAAAVVKEYGVDAKKLWTPPELISGPQIEKLVPKKRREEFAEAYLVSPPGKLTVVHESDPRPAVNSDPADAFDDEYGEDFG